LKHILAHVLVSAAVTAGALWYYHQYYSLRLATFDMPAYANQLKDEYIQGRLTREKLDERLKDLSLRLKNDYSDTVVLLKGAVISGKVLEIDPSK